MGIAKLFEDVRKAQERHKVLTYVIHFVLSTIMLGGFWVLIRFDDDRYFWLGVAMVLIPCFAMLPSWVRHD